MKIKLETKEIYMVSPTYESVLEKMPDEKYQLFGDAYVHLVPQLEVVSWEEDSSLFLRVVSKFIDPTKNFGVPLQVSIELDKMQAIALKNIIQGFIEYK